MPRIEEDIKLDFKDVLIRPKRSTLKSRSEVTLERTYTFKHSPRTWTGVPIMAANMDTTGTFEMAIVFTQHKLITCIHKHYTVDEWVNFQLEHPECVGNIAVSCGTSADDFEKISSILSRVDVPFICIDVANGYSEHVRSVGRSHFLTVPTVCSSFASNPRGFPR